MTGNHFQICVLEQVSTGRGYVLHPDICEHITISRIMIQVLHALSTPRGQASLAMLAVQWCAEFRPELPPEACVSPFLDILGKAIGDRREWPTLVLRYGLKNVDAIFSAKSAAFRATQFRVQDFLITLNGNRVHMYMQDINSSRNERYVRFLELFTSCVHEIGHMFITFLHMTFRQRCSLRDPRSLFLQYGPGEPEAGYVLEHYFFGGVLHRKEDESGRGDANMVGIPVLVNEDGLHGVHLGTILRLANHRGPYPLSMFPALFPLQTYPPNAHCNLSPRAKFFRFYQSWWATFREDFADRARDYVDDIVPQEAHSARILARLRKKGEKMVEVKFPKRWRIPGQEEEQDVGEGCLRGRRELWFGGGGQEKRKEKQSKEKKSKKSGGNRQHRDGIERM